MESIGVDSSSMSPAPMASERAGRVVTRRAQRALSESRASVADPVRALPIVRRSILWPAKPHRPGTSGTAVINNGRASGRERGGQDVEISGGAVDVKKKKK